MDDILREVRDIREAFAREFDYDLDRIHNHLVEEQEKMRNEGWRIVDFSRPRTPGYAGSSTPTEDVEQGGVPRPSSAEPTRFANPEMTTNHP